MPRPAGLNAATRKLIEHLRAEHYAPKPPDPHLAFWAGQFPEGTYWRVVRPHDNAVHDAVGIVSLVRVTASRDVRVFLKGIFPGRPARHSFDPAELTVATSEDWEVHRCLRRLG